MRLGRHRSGDIPERWPTRSLYASSVRVALKAFSALAVAAAASALAFYVQGLETASAIEPNPFRRPHTKIGGILIRLASTASGGRPGQRERAAAPAPGSARDSSRLDVFNQGNK
jgi:hypothetical protein